MKKSTLINSEVSYLLSKLGHTDEVTICDAGLPISDHTWRIDLALTRGVPRFLETVRAVLSELQIEGALIAEEFANSNPEHYNALMMELDTVNPQTKVTLVSHDEFKVLTKRSRAIVRTGECTPYANIILQSGVVF